MPRSRPQLAVALILLIGDLCRGYLPAESAESFDSLLRRGFALHQQSSFAEAIPLLQRADRLKPRDYFANLLLGIDLLRTGETAAAIPRLKLASSLRPGEEIPAEYLGEAEAKLGHFAAAAEAYEDAVSRSHASEDSEQAWAGYSLERFRQIGSELRASGAGLAVAYRLQAESLRAANKEQANLLRQSIENDPAAPGIWSELGLAQLAAGDREGASASRQQALARNPDDLEAWRLASLLAAGDARWPEAAAQLHRIGERSAARLRQALDSWPRDLVPPPSNEEWPWRCVRLGDATSCEIPHRPAAKVQAPDEARWYREQRWEQIAALPVPPATQSREWRERGVALASLNRCAQALPALERGMQSGHSEAGYWLSVCYASEAGRAAQELEAKSRDAAVVHRLHGDVLLRLKGDAAGAEAEYRAALLTRGGDPALLERLAEAQLSAGETDAAAQSAHAALQVDPHRMDALRTLAHIASNSRNYNEALPYLRQVAEAEPADRAAAAELGTALAETSHPDEAVRTLKPLLDGGYPDEKGSLHALLGQVFRKLGREQDAAQAFAEARRRSDAYQDRADRNQHVPQ